MSLSFKDGEPCDHPGCLGHVTHPCEGCGRVAGRGSVRIAKTTWGETRDVWLIKGISPDDKLFNRENNRAVCREFASYFFEESSAERQTRELAEHYHDATDEFDIALCPRTAGFPETSEQRRASIENARRTKEELYRCIAPLGVSPQMWTDEIRRAAQRTRGRCRD